MVQKVGLMLTGLVAVVAIGILLIQLQDTLTGNYVKTGGGYWYFGPQKAQLQPDEACRYAGHEPALPWNVRTNEYGTQVSVCADGAEVPMVQTIVVP